MKVNLYAVYDVASGVYDGPVPAQADGTAIRNFSDMAVNAEHPIGKHPSDFTLFKVGIWNDGTGKVEGCESIKLINGLEAVSNSRQVNGRQLSLIDEEISDDDKFVGVGGTA